MTKKLLFIGFFGVVMTSCSKEYTCECTVHDSNDQVVSTSSTTIKGTKSKATDECAQNESEQMGSNHTTCHLH